MTRLALCLALTAGPAFAETGIVADLPVTAALVGAVSDTPVRALVAPGADPHTLSLRPSEARAVAEADLLVTVAGASPWLDGARNADAPALRLEAPEGAAHAWLDPAVAQGWLSQIADALAELDPGQAEALRTAADAASASVAEVAGNVSARIAAAGPVRIIAGHDAWAAAERAFDLEIAAALSDDHGHGPGAGHLREVEEVAAEADCILLAPGDDRQHADRLAEVHGLPVVSVPIVGTDSEIGVTGYTGILTALAEAVETCAAD